MQCLSEWSEQLNLCQVFVHRRVACPQPGAVDRRIDFYTILDAIGEIRIRMLDVVRRSVGVTLGGSTTWSRLRSRAIIGYRWPRTLREPRWEAHIQQWMSSG
ncbi:hypothetical protein EVAR_36481_1 [Eumeta japonica]|uniref:Uncharacterized protein n=1 Tax=Eumeta variegata TaxID=151549 RepID=A0A4C1WW21_EUMVA|nr:hypothetical protein EVAR_36481_1 [Eumeta japonica]